MHPVPLDGTDGKVANEPSRVRVSVVEPSGTWTFGLGKNRDIQMYTFAPTWSHRAISIHPVDTSYTYVSRYSDTTRYTDTHVSPPLRASQAEPERG